MSSQFDVTAIPRNGQLTETVHQQWVATLDAIRDPIFVIDNSGRLVRMNRAFAKLASAAYPELIRKPLTTVLPWISSKGPQQIEELQTAPDERIFQIRCFPFNGPDTDCIAIMEDVTPERALEMAEKKYREDSTRAMIETLQTMVSTLRIKDPYTAAHCLNVAELSRRIAVEIGNDDLYAQGIYFGALVHDLGKLYVPSGILNRPGKLAVAEFNLIKMHPEVGFSIIKNLAFPWPLSEIILQHHERMNGSGYPAGLKGDAISIAARIVAVADVVEAISSHRPYRPALGIDAALCEIESNREVLYDTEVVGACLTIFDDAREEILENWTHADANSL